MRIGPGCIGEFMRRLRRDRRGAVAVLTALASTALLGFTGLAVDVGVWKYMQGRLQQTVDQASRAATIALMDGQNPTIAARTVAASYGFVNGRNGVTVTVNWPPTQGTYAGSGMAVEVIIQAPAPEFFSRLFL
jgi:Flp pilus assembly protein TadG